MRAPHILLLLVFPLLVIAPAGADQKKMNVLFLVADDLNSWLLEDPERYAGKVIAPNLRKLANSGVNFTRAYAAAPICSPSRAAFSPASAHGNRGTTTTR